MGITTLRATIANPAAPTKQKTVEFMVDSGAVYSVVSEKLLQELGIKPITEKEFFLANGDGVKRKLGGALYGYGGEKGYAPVIFGKKGDVNLLGAVTLEALGLVLDPLQRRLLALPMVLGGMGRRT